MRKRFEQSPKLDFHPISDIKINTKSRHQLPPLLVGLQYIFTHPELSEEVFEILEQKITNQKKKTGRIGMSLWEILVLGIVRLNLDVDYDFLVDLANNHYEFRGILGIRSKGVFDEDKIYIRQTVVDNIYLIDEEMLIKINDILVKAGHGLLKKKGEILALNIKSDSYAVESNIHFPTDINLSWDSARKILEMIEKIKNEAPGLLSEFRKSKAIRKSIKSKNRKVANIHSKKGANYNERLEQGTKTLIESYNKLLKKVALSLQECKTSNSPKVVLLSLSLRVYRDYLKKMTDQLRRRILEGEQIPHSEKIFSIFEPEVEWLQKGKQNNKVELGHNVLITTDQYHFILDYKVMVKQRDNSQPLELQTRLQEKFKKGYELKSISFDRGFFSKLSKQGMEKVFTTVVMPNKGKQSKSTKAKQAGKEYSKLMNKHSAVESNINELEHSGVNKVPDKGLVGFKRYVGYGVLAYNLKRLGKLVLQEQEQVKAQKKKPINKAA